MKIVINGVGGRVLVALMLAAAMIAEAQDRHQASVVAERNTRDKALNESDRLASQARERGDTQKEIELRQKLSAEAWINYRQHPNDPGRWNRWAIVYENDLPLALLLEGTHQWPAAEAIYRRNQSELAHERLAGNDIKSENELHLAHLIALEGKVPEANQICSHWKFRMRHIAAGQDSDHWHGEPKAPLYDTPEVETATWDLACSSPEQGLKLLSEQIKAHPRMLAPYTVLSNYYLSKGDFQKALDIEKEGTAALLHP